jgi:hypothetical protein
MLEPIKMGTVLTRVAAVKGRCSSLAIRRTDGPKTTHTAKHNAKAIVLVRMIVQGNAAGVL